jgi:hypothetical protein
MYADFPNRAFRCGVAPSITESPTAESFTVPGAGPFLVGSFPGLTAGAGALRGCGTGATFFVDAAGALTVGCVAVGAGVATSCSATAASPASKLCSIGSTAAGPPSVATSTIVAATHATPTAHVARGNGRIAQPDSVRNGRSTKR